MPFLVFVAILIAICIIGAIAVRIWSGSYGFGIIVFGALLLIASLIGGYQYLTQYSNDHWVTCHVTGKDRTKDMNGESDARVYTTDCGTLQNIDSKLRFKFNSSDIQGQIPDKGVVTVHIAGWRHEFGSFFPNILEVSQDIPKG